MRDMLVDHAVGRDILLLGGKGEGKTVVVNAFADALGYKTEVMSLYKDMTARDLLQRRVTDSNGNTNWAPSPLVTAALHGRVAILDGVDRISSDTLASLQRLVQDRAVDLFDGTRLRPAAHVDMYTGMGGAMEGGVDALGGAHDAVLKVHPAFRVVAVGAPPNDDNPWLVDEVVAMFNTHYLPRLSEEETRTIIAATLPTASSSSSSTSSSLVDSILRFATALRGDGGKGDKGDKGRDSSSSMSGDASLAGQAGVEPLSLRQLLRATRRVAAFEHGDASEARARQALNTHLWDTLLGAFLPTTQRATLSEVMERAGLHGDPANTPTALHATDATDATDGGSPAGIDTVEGVLRIGAVTRPVTSPVKHPELIPSPRFFEVPSQVTVMENMLGDLNAGDRHLLLIGNQGVGKNKIADRLLELLQDERECAHERLYVHGFVCRRQQWVGVVLRSAVSKRVYV